jgi:hypothetical protein
MRGDSAITCEPALPLRVQAGGRAADLSSEPLLPKTRSGGGPATCDPLLRPVSTFCMATRKPAALDGRPVYVGGRMSGRLRDEALTETGGALGEDQVFRVRERPRAVAGCALAFRPLRPLERRRVWGRRRVAACRVVRRRAVRLRPPRSSSSARSSLPASSRSSASRASITSLALVVASAIGTHSLGLD